MVLHAGIVCYKKDGSMMTYNSETGQKQFYNLIAVGPHDINGVDIMFDNIKTQVTGEFGCACICLGYTYDSEIRKKFIDTAKEFGFVNVHITDWCSMNYYDLVPRLPKYRINPGHVIWIFCGKYCYVWEKGRYFAEFIDEFEYTDTVGSLKLIRRKSETNPTYIFYGHIYETKWKTVEKIFKNAVVYHFDSLNSVHGVLIGALIMADYSNLRYLKTEAMLERDIKIKIYSIVIMSVYKWQELPCKCQKSIKKPNGCTTMEIMSHFNKTHIKLPDFDHFLITLHIDVNGICSITYEQEQPTETENINVGIMPSQNEIACGHTLVQQTTYSRENLDQELHTIDKIDSLLKLIKESISLASNQCYGSIYVFLDSSYNNGIRKQLINSGLKIGFKDVKIVDQESMNSFCETMNFFDQNIGLGTNIWLINGIRCHLWKYFPYKVNYMGYICGDYSSEEGLKEMKILSKFNVDPDSIFFYNNEDINDIVEKVFPDCKFKNLKDTVTKWKEYTFEMYCRRIYQCDAVLDREIVAKIGDEEIVIAEAYQRLPLSITKELKNDTNNDELIITESKNEIIHIPTNDTFKLQIDIDKNGIYSVTVNDVDMKNELENTEVIDEESAFKETEKVEILEHKNDEKISIETEKLLLDTLTEATCPDVTEEEDAKAYDSENSIDEPKLPESKEKLKMPEFSASMEKPFPDTFTKETYPEVTVEEDVSESENSIDESPLPESKEKLKDFRKPMIMPEFLTPQEMQESNALEQLLLMPSIIPRKFIPQTDEALSPPINELALLPPPSYEESQSYFRQPSPVPFHHHQSEASLPAEEEEKNEDDDNDTIEQLRAKLAEQKRALIDRLEPKMIKWAPKEYVKKISDMMVHKDISELLEYMENEDLLKSKVFDALSFLRGTTSAASRPRNQIRVRRQQPASPHTPTSSNSETRPRWR